MNRIKRFRLYDAIIGERRVCPVSDIGACQRPQARGSGTRPARHGAARLFSAGLCGRRDRLLLCRQCRLARTEPRACPPAGRSAGQRAAPARAAAQEPVPEDEPGGGYLRELERQLARIENADIRAKAARLREHTEDIFAWVKLHPECADDARRFCSYYLPTAVKLLNTYNEVAPHADESSVAAGIQSEVSQVLDTMSTAFRGLMDNLLQNTAVDMAGRDLGAGDGAGPGGAGAKRLYDAEMRRAVCPAAAVV